MPPACCSIDLPPSAATDAPGLIDTHVHAPQYKFTGTGTDVPLMEWLRKYTFPTEESYKDVEAAEVRHTVEGAESLALRWLMLECKRSPRPLIVVVHCIGSWQPGPSPPLSCASSAPL